MTDLILKTADEISQEAFAAMVNSYMKNGTPFLGMTSPNDYEAFLRMCRAHESGKRLPRGSVPYTRYFMFQKKLSLRETKTRKKQLNMRAYSKVREIILWLLIRTIIFGLYGIKTVLFGVDV